MPGYDDSMQGIPHISIILSKQVQRVAKRHGGGLLTGFKQFLLRGTVIDMAVGAVLLLSSCSATSPGYK
jgi:hypothetical protein